MEGLKGSTWTRRNKKEERKWDDREDEDEEHQVEEDENEWMKMIKKMWKFLVEFANE